MRVKVLIIIISLMVLTFGLGISYSYFNSGIVASTVDQKIAGFVFNAQVTDKIEIPVGELAPGETNSHYFSVANIKDGVKSDVTIEYELIILTPHYAPLIIELYKDNELVLSCNETYSRNDNNELVCKTDVFELSHEKDEQNGFELKITFDKNYDSEEFANLVDYINLEIKSYQKV